jgi:hypothetical protein
VSLTLKVGSSTPWGAAQEAREVIPGFWTVSCAGHGGVKLDRARHARLPAGARKPGGWFEEDCEAAIPMLAFFDELQGKAGTATRESLVLWLTRYEPGALAALSAAGAHL